MKKSNYSSIPSDEAKFITKNQCREKYNLSVVTINKILSKYPQCRLKIGKAVRINVSELDKLFTGTVEL